MDITRNQNRQNNDSTHCHENGKTFDGKTADSFGYVLVPVRKEAFYNNRCQLVKDWGQNEQG